MGWVGGCLGNLWSCIVYFVAYMIGMTRNLGWWEDDDQINKDLILASELLFDNGGLGLY